MIDANMSTTETPDSAKPVSAEALQKRIRDLDQAAADGRARLQILVGQRQTARGVLAFDDVQPEGKRAMNATAWLAGLRGDVRVDPA